MIQKSFQGTSTCDFRHLYHLWFPKLHTHISYSQNFHIALDRWKETKWTQLKTVFEYVSLLLGSHIRHGSRVILQLFLVFLPIILGVLLHLLLQPQALYLKSDTSLDIRVHMIFFLCFRLSWVINETKTGRVSFNFCRGAGLHCWVCRQWSENDLRRPSVTRLVSVASPLNNITLFQTH